MPITHIHTYLVHPLKGEAAPPTLGGTDVPLSGKMFDLLKGVYDKSDSDCDISISFNQSISGAQQNLCRDLIVAYKTSPSLALGENIAQRLAMVTTRRSGLGLLFLVCGQEGLDHKVMISRFPADSGILAEQNSTGLNVEFLERIFMKSAKSYKAVLYKDHTLASGFWSGKAVDKQINNLEMDSSKYWISEFLDSDFVTTAEAGTRRLAVAMRNALKETSDLGVKGEIIAAATLAPGLKGQKLSIEDFANRMALSEGAKKAVFAKTKPAVLKEKFKINEDEFSKQLAYKTIELDSGAMLTAETSKFDKLFKSIAVDGQRQRYSTEGKVVNETVSRGRVR